MNPPPSAPPPPPRPSGPKAVQLGKDLEATPSPSVGTPRWLGLCGRIGSSPLWNPPCCHSLWLPSSALPRKMEHVGERNRLRPWHKPAGAVPHGCGTEFEWGLDM